MLVKGSSTDPTPRWIRASVAGAAACLLPLGLVYCGTDVHTQLTAPEEKPMPSPKTTVVVVMEPDDPDSLATEPKEPLGGDPQYAYWRLGSSDMDRPQPLADAPVQPVACRLDPAPPDEETRDEAMAACAAAMSEGLQEAGVSDDGYVCVQWGNTARRRGFCASQVPTERFLLHGNATGSVLLEKIVVVGSEG